MVLDGAGWHIAKDLRVPNAVTLVQVPAYSSVACRATASSCVIPPLAG